jgi:SAM-dependent methyltransferase
MGLLDLLKLPETKNLQDLDAPETTLRHRQIIRSKSFLKRLYLDFYANFSKEVPGLASKTCVELGSGGGFLKEVFPSVITSDVLPLPGVVDRCFSGLEMPFADRSVDAFLMVDVFHHVPDSALFLREMDRCLKPGGQIVMIEPANTLWGRWIYQNFHHEPFDPSAGWTLPSGGPLSSANGALPWIVFKRDFLRFQREFPGLRVKSISYHAPFRYLVSGGLSLRQLLPGWMYPPVKGFEWLLSPLQAQLGLFMLVSLQKFGEARVAPEKY